MAKEVVISTNLPAESRSRLWSMNFKAASRSTREVVFCDDYAFDRWAATITSAVALAGNGGKLIFNVGHGGIASNGSRMQAFIAVSPGLYITGGGAQVVLEPEERRGIRSLTEFDLTLEVPSTSGGATTTLSQASMAKFNAFRNVGTAIANAGVDKVIFLSCQTGQRPDFLREIKRYFRCNILAFNENIAFQTIQSRVGRRTTISPPRLCLEADCALIDQRSNVPQAENSLHILTFNRHTEV